MKEIVKTNHIVGNRGGEVAAIKQVIKRASIMIKLQLKHGHLTEKPTY